LLPKKQKTPSSANIVHSQTPMTAANWQPSSDRTLQTLNTSTNGRTGMNNTLVLQAARCLRIGFWLTLLTLPAWAQALTGPIEGTIKDEQGGSHHRCRDHRHTDRDQSDA
jgi:hypothetical protein